MVRVRNAGKPAKSTVNGQNWMSIMRTTRLSFSLSAALGLALGATILAAPVPAIAAEDDGRAWDSKLIGGFLEGLGLRRDGEGITYQERAPLVIPPSSAALPPPEKSDAVVANNPAWPKDPDVARRKAEEKADRERRKLGAQEQTDKEMGVLRGNDLTPGGSSTRSARTNDNYTNPGHGYGNQYDIKGGSGGLFGMMFGSRDDDVASFTGEPPRGSLTDPPRGYQTPSPNQPYGLARTTTAPKAVDDQATRPEAK